MPRIHYHMHMLVAGLTPMHQDWAAVIKNVSYRILKPTIFLCFLHSILIVMWSKQVLHVCTKTQPAVLKTFHSVSIYKTDHPFFVYNLSRALNNMTTIFGEGNDSILARKPSNTSSWSIPYLLNPSSDSFQSFLEKNDRSNELYNFRRRGRLTRWSILLSSSSYF